MSKHIHNLIEYWKEIDSIPLANGEILLFRGHSRCDYKLEPSIFREKEPNIESTAYREIMVDSPEKFQSRNHMSNLSLMQHYGSRTRLLDFSTNPLYSLFFATETFSHEAPVDAQVVVCTVKKENILHHNSDKALMLSCIPCFSDEDQQNIKKFCEQHPGRISERDILPGSVMARFLHEIRRECPAFACEIIGEDLLKNYFIQTYKDNERIKIQSGLFLLFGLKDRFIDNSTQYHLKRINIAYDAKLTIQNELKRINITTSTVYPDFERRAMEIFHRKVEWTQIRY